MLVASFFVGGAAIAAPRGVTVAARRGFAQHLKAGRALEAKGDWRGAVAELTTALAMLPHEPSALSELSYAALEAHEWARAREAGTECTTASIEPKQRAACFYNLGRIAEETADKPTAMTMYRHALILRDSDVVLNRLRTLDPAAKAPESQGLPCWRPHPIQALLACISDDLDAPVRDPDAPLPCRFAREKLPGVQLVECSANRSSWTYLVTEDADGWATRLEVGSGAERAHFTRDFHAAGLSDRMVGKRRVLSVQTAVVNELDVLFNPDGYGKETINGEVFYVPGSSAPPLRVTDEYHFARYTLPSADGSDGTLIATASYKARVDLGDDGTVTVVELSRSGTVPAAEGAIMGVESSPGKHRLW
jgi:hypothetical protein